MLLFCCPPLEGDLDALVSSVSSSTLDERHDNAIKSWGVCFFLITNILDEDADGVQPTAAGSLRRPREL